MAFEHAFFDEQGQRAVGVALTTLQALAPLTSDPTATLAAMGITDPTLEAALLKIAELAASDTPNDWRSGPNANLGCVNMARCGQVPVHKEKTCTRY